MSWEPWVNNLLQYPGVNTAAICGMDGSVWAKSANINPSAKEVQDLASGIRKPSPAEFSSFHLNNERFVVVRLDSGEMMGKKECYNIAVMMAKTCFVIGGYMPTGDADADKLVAEEGGGPKANIAVAKIRDALADSGM